MANITKVVPKRFEEEKHFYPKLLEQSPHKTAATFLGLSNLQIAKRYKQLRPETDLDALVDILSYEPKYFYWGGSDLFPCTTRNNSRDLLLIETNSCPSGQKSYPYGKNPADKQYRFLLENSFLPLAKKQTDIDGAYAVFFDKNPIENTGYAQTLANITEKPVFLVEFKELGGNVKYENRVVKIRQDGKWVPIKAIFKYVTQQPWNRIPPNTKTFVYNNILACLAGGRNKLIANKAYELLNLKWKEQGLKINFPKTIRDARKIEVPEIIDSMGGTAVVKAPYENAGQGVHTITSYKELQAFLEAEHTYDKFIVQELIGHAEWNEKKDAQSHRGTLPGDRGEVYIADLRMMVARTSEGYRPVVFYMRRGRNALTAERPRGSSWDMLGTNLSRKVGKDEWEYDVERLLPATDEDFEYSGLTRDDLVEGFVQTVLSIRAIDELAKRLVNNKGTFNKDYLRSFYEDKRFLEEIMQL